MNRYTINFDEIDEEILLKLSKLYGKTFSSTVSTIVSEWIQINTEMLEGLGIKLKPVKMKKGNFKLNNL